MVPLLSYIRHFLTRRCYTAAKPSAARRTSQQTRHVLGDDTTSFSAPTGVLYLLDVSAGRPRSAARNPSSVTLESPEALVPFQEPSAGPHKRQSSVPYSGFSQLYADRQQYAAASPPATHPHAALAVSSHSPPRVP
jgi:hypothetical protein